MAHDPDEDRIRAKAHELWEAEGHPHGRDAAHWEQAREIIALQDSQATTLLPRETGSDTPVESSDLRASYGDVPNLTDQGEHDLTSVAREPVGIPPAPSDAMTSDEITSFARSTTPLSTAAKKPVAPKSVAKPAPKSETPLPPPVPPKAAKPAVSKAK